MKNILILLFIFSGLSGFSQVMDVKLQLNYDEDIQLYELFLVVDKGTANSQFQKVQANSLVTLITPPGSDFELIEAFNPKSNGNPIQWVEQLVFLDPQGLVNKNYRGIVPNISPTGFYDSLVEGEHVKLFSFKISGADNCMAKTRLFENNHDHEELIELGLDFRMGITIGGPAQIYKGNIYQNVNNESGIICINDQTQIETPIVGGTYISSESSVLQVNSEGLISGISPGKATVTLIDINSGCEQFELFYEVLSSEDSRCSSTSLSHIDEKNIRLYPNPTSDYFQLDNLSPYSNIKVVDIIGREIYKSNTGSRQEELIEVTEWKPGIYIVRIQNKDFRKSLKLKVSK